jgi:nucleotide-binding universal stress UspA family protein
MKPAEVIVGVDGSGPSRIALRWAAAEAARRGTTLEIVHAYRARRPDAADSPTQAEPAADADGKKVLAAAFDDVRLQAPGLATTGAAVQSGAAAALLDASDPGDLIVVGNRGHSELAAILAGSTCQQVALHARTSVAVVRGDVDSTGGPVVVGYDGSTAALGVLEAAFEAAAARGCGVTVVRAFRPTMPSWPADAAPPTVLNAQTAKAALTDELKRVGQPLTDKYPDVAVEYSVPGGDPAQVLVDASRGAQLVVVGSRGHGGFTGLLLGSVGLHLMHHSHCPVLIVRPHAA